MADEDKNADAILGKIDEGFEAVGKTIDEKLEAQKTASADEIKALREEMEEGFKKSQKAVEIASDPGYTKKMDAFTKEGQMWVGDRYCKVDDFFRAAVLAAGLGPQTGVAEPKSLTKEQFVNWQAEMKVLNEGTTTAGGYLVPDQMDAMILQLLVDDDMISSKATRITTSRDHLLINTEATEPSGAFLAESADIEAGSTDAVFGQSDITVYAYKAGFKLTNELLADSLANVGQYLTSKMAEQIAYSIQQYIISGTGSSQPFGITAATPGTTDQFTAGSLAMNDLHKAYYGIGQKYRRSAVWGVRNDLMPTILGLTTGTGGNQWFAGSAAQGPPNTILGKTIIADDNWDANDVDFVDMDGYIMADRGSTEFFVTPHTYANEYQTYFRFIRRWGGQLVRTNGYYKLNSS